MTEQKEPENTGFKSSTKEEKVIALAKEQGFVTRKEIHKINGVTVQSDH